MDIGKNFKFYQDNDVKYKARIVQEHLICHCPKLLYPPPQSPNLNPIENLWDNLNKRIRATPINTRDELKKSLQKEWKETSTEYI